MYVDPKRARHLVPGGNIGGPALQTQGLTGCFVIERSEVPQMMYAAEGGDHTAAQIRIGIGLWGQQAFGPKMGPQQCACCDHTFSGPTEPEAFFLAIPFQGDGDSIVSAVCRACVRKIGSEGLIGKCAEHMKKLWPKAVITGDVAGARKP